MIEKANYVRINLVKNIFNNPNINLLHNALSFSNESISYKELFNRIILLSNWFLEMGLKSTHVVAILLPRNQDFITCLLALFNIGATVLPLEEGCPEDRLNYILSDTKAKYILTNNTLLSLPEGCVVVIPLQLDRKRQIEEFIFIEHPIEWVAYIVYTSGSTGIPKRVDINYENFYYYCKNLQERLNITAKDTYAFTASIGFSSMFRQIFLPLLVGAEIKLIAEDERKDPALFAKSLVKLTIIDLIPSFQEVLLSYLEKKDLFFYNIRLILSASEPLKHTIRQAFHTLFPHACFINMYGLTETSGIIATYSIAKNSDLKQENYYVPIGKPITDTMASLIDESAHSLEYGELCVATPSLALNLITEKNEPGVVIDNVEYYKTGDIMKYDSDGNLVYIGRLDRQIKISGKRLHLNEIDKCIEEQQPVTKSVTILVPGNRLVTFVKMKHGYTLNVTQLKDAIARKLIAQLVPYEFHVVDEFPLTSSRKLDYKKLSEIYQAINSQRKANFEDNLTCEWEVKVYSVFTEQLQIKEIHPEANLFELGADSLKIALAIAKITNDLNIDIKLSDVFANPSIRLLAKIIKSELKING